ncbi:MAG: tyrosine-type recombinase/integrase [Campylobacterota bacterium]|nr:tyrosine-type recombinase/integrase [Campylobacterota bacterium]
MIKMTQPKLFNRGRKLWIRFSLDGNVVKKSLNIEDNKINRKIATNEIIPQMLLKVHSGEFFNNKIVPTLLEMTHNSLSSNINSRKYLTTKGYKSVFKNHIIPHFGDMKLDKITSSLLRKWQNDLLGTYSPKYTMQIRIVLNGVLEDARRDEIIDKNPLSLVKSPKISSSRDLDPFTMEEMYKILDNIPKKIRVFYAIGFFTGMRTGEITALKVSDLDLSNQVITINHTRNRGVETTPKTDSSTREIDIIDALIPYLEEHLRMFPNNHYLIESNKNGPYYSSSKLVETYWRPTLEKLNINYRVQYQMRHTFATLSLTGTETKKGEDVLWVSNMLGHKDASITLKVYAKYIKNNERKRGAFLSR